jgi:hypothetical protein
MDFRTIFRRSFVRLVGLALLCSASLSFHAQTPPEKAATTQAAQEATPHFKLGDSAVELGGLWKFHVGDDMAWSQPDFNDSAWGTMDLTPPAGTGDATLGTSGIIPGWTSTGFPDHSGYAWYRLRVNVEGASRTLALKMPDNADDAYQVYINGVKVGEFGKFGEHHVTAYSAQPQEYRLPKAVRNGPITIAIRMWMDSATPFNSPDAGGMHGPPVLGFASVIATQTRLDWDEIDHEVGTGFLEVLILAMSLFMALALFWLDREEKAYVWLAMVCSVTLFGNITVLLVNFTTLVGQTSGQFLTDVILAPVRIGMWVLFWGYWFRLKRLEQLHKIVWPLVGALAVGVAMLRPPLYEHVVPVHDGKYLVPLLLVIKLILAVVLFVVAYYGFKRRKSEGALALIAIILAAISNYQHELRLIHVPTRTNILDYDVSLGTVSTILSLLIITVMLLQRFVFAQRLKEQWKMEIQQAREIQQVLIPATLPKIDGLSIESEYRPAREVGGDFFQILPGATAGSALIVVGDVTGKGLQAGMLVALIVGSIRTAAQHTTDPARILALVNDELCEREHASATCMILQFGPEGDIHVANAGQIPPYLNGGEVETEGAFPLGTIGGMDYGLTTFHLAVGDSLILMSDGIAEAQDPQGNLYGFERVNELLSKPITAAEIATAAQKFGQEDDILVLRIQREVHGEVGVA